MCYCLLLCITYCFGLWKVAPKQTVPVAPRTRTSHEEALLEVIHGQNQPSKVNSQIQEEEPREQTLGRIPGSVEYSTIVSSEQKAQLHLIDNEIL